jgi:hypothetical protein
MEVNETSKRTRIFRIRVSWTLSLCFLVVVGPDTEEVDVISLRTASLPGPPVERECRCRSQFPEAERAGNVPGYADIT